MQDQSRCLSLPKGNARKITLLMGIPALLAYMAKVLINQSLEYERGPYGSLWWIICPIACLVGVGFVVLVLGLTIIAVRRAQHAAPAVVVIVGLGLSIFLPMPPLPKPVFPEEVFFTEHRAELEAVINLARQQKLECVADRGCKSLARNLPPNFVHLSDTGIVLVFHGSPRGLTVTFHPLNWYYPIVYFEKPEDRNLSWNSKCWDSRWVRKLDEHWYLCVED